ncbi:hypothetical protein ACQP1W_22055 [Spirillospora sp. CA-255316]
MTDIITPHTTATTDTATADTTDGDGDRPRPDGAAGAVWDALSAAQDGATVTALAEASGVSRATVTKALISFADAGCAVRTPGKGTGRNRTPDLWTAVTATGPVPEASGTDTSGTVPAGGPKDDADTRRDATEANAGVISSDALATAMRVLSDEAERRVAAAESLRKAQEEEAARRAHVDAEMHKAQQRESVRVVLADLLSMVTTTLAAVTSEEDDRVAQGLEEIARLAATVRRATGTAAGSRGQRAPRATGDRGAPSPLRPLVAEHLHAHPESEFTPGEIARVLGRSSGAVANALDTLVGQGVAILTCERPRRFRAVNTGTDGADGFASGDARGAESGNTDSSSAA